MVCHEHSEGKAGAGDCRLNCLALASVRAQSGCSLPPTYIPLKISVSKAAIIDALTLPTTGEKGYIIGDFKQNTKEVAKLIASSEPQWRAIREYAKRHESVPIIYFPTYINPLSNYEIVKMRGDAIKQNVVVFSTSLRMAGRKFLPQILNNKLGWVSCYAFEFSRRFKPAEGFSFPNTQFE